MTLTELTQSLIETTKRPDKLSAMKIAINKAVQQIAIMHFFVHDLHEVTWSVDPADALAFSLTSADYGEGLRKIEYIQVVGSQRFLKQIAPKDVFCNSRKQTDVFYRTGSSIYVQLETAATQLLLGLYRYPTQLVNDADHNWVTDLYPYAVLDGAAAMIFKSIGDDASAQMHQEEFRLACIQIMSDLKQGEIT